MSKPKRIETNVKPNSIERLGNNSYYYNYDIKEEMVISQDINNKGTKEKSYNFILVLLYGLPNYKDCIRAIIRSYVTLDEEFDLINSANSVSLGVRTLPEDKQKYLDYLVLVQDIKNKVKIDFNIK